MAQPDSAQRACRWCGLDADLAPTTKPDGTGRTLEHSGNGVQVACLQAMLAEIKALRERVAALEDRANAVEQFAGALDARTIGSQMLGGRDGY